jgi:hypothetical protein
LDIVFEKSPYLHARPYEINMKWLKIKEPKVFVSVPSPEEMLGDKMTAFAPLSIGKLYSEGRYVEICKQLYDIAFLSRIAEDKQLIKDSYLAVSSIEIENRKGTFSQEFAQEDSLEALRLILSEGHRPTGKENFQYLQKGKKGLEDFLVEKYGGQEWLRDAADAYLVYGEIVFKKSTNKQAKNSNTFIGRRYSTLKRVLGEDKMKKLMIMVNNDPKKDN